MDALSDVLRVVRLSGAVYLNGEFSAPWCMIAQPDSELCKAFLPRSERVVAYHLITEGGCRARLTDDAKSTVQLNAGELMVVPQGDGHIMGSTLEIPPASTAPLLAGSCRQHPAR
jgi:hypothetical protein